MDPNEITDEEFDEVFVITVPEGEYEEIVFPIVDEEESEGLLADL